MLGERCRQKHGIGLPKSLPRRPPSVHLHIQESNPYPLCTHGPATNSLERALISPPKAHLRDSSSATAHPPLYFHLLTTLAP